MIVQLRIWYRQIWDWIGLVGGGEVLFMVGSRMGCLQVVIQHTFKTTNY